MPQQRLHRFGVDFAAADGMRREAVANALDLHLGAEEAGEEDETFVQRHRLRRRQRPVVVGVLGVLGVLCVCAE